MKLRSIKVLITFFLGFSFNVISFSQITEIIRVKREGQLFFFQKGNNSDTITKSKGNLFYLIVPDSLKEFISVQTENGQLLPTTNDSLLKFNFIKGIRYESVFSKENEGTKFKKRFSFKTLINGAMENPHHKIIIKITDKRENILLMENSFFYKE